MRITTSTENSKKWTTEDGLILVECEAEETRFYSAQVPEGLLMLDSAHTYELYDPATDENMKVYKLNRQGDEVTLHEVKEDQLLVFSFRYYEEETLGRPCLSRSRPKVLLKNLRPT